MATLLQSDDFQSDDDLALQIAERRERRIKEAILTALLALIGTLSGSVVALYLARWNLRGLNQIIGGAEVQNEILTAYTPVADAFIEAARETANDQFGELIAYDHLQASAGLIEMRSRFVSDISAQARDVMQQALVGALRRGVPADAVQAQLQSVIGLTPRQAQAVANYRSLLENGDLSALDRKLRDARFDGTVRQAVENDVRLAQDKIDRMVERYAQRSLEFRAETVARTEAMNAATGGIRDAYVQAVNSGKLMDSEVRRFWLICRDERTCPICRSIPILNPNGVGVLEPYKSVAGPVMQTGIHPRCRCSERYQANLTRLTVQPFAQAA